MGEVKESESEPVGEPLVKEPDRELGPGGLPVDLRNAAIGFNYALENYKEGNYSEDEFRESLRHAQTFDDYYRAQVRMANKPNVREDRALYDEDASIEVQRQVVTDQEAISRFDEKMLELRALANDKVINIKRVEKIVGKEIAGIFSGKKLKTKK